MKNNLRFCYFFPEVIYFSITVYFNIFIASFYFFSLLFKQITVGRYHMANTLTLTLRSCKKKTRRRRKEKDKKHTVRFCYFVLFFKKRQRCTRQQYHCWTRTIGIDVWVFLVFHGEGFKRLKTSNCANFSRTSKLLHAEI